MSINQLDLLHQHFNEVLIPPSVRAEALEETSRQALNAFDWIRTRSLGARKQAEAPALAPDKTVSE